MELKPIEIIKALSALKTLSDSATDEQASRAPHAYKGLRRDGKIIKAGTRINHKGTIMRATEDVLDVEENSPDKKPTLWEDIGYRNGVRVKPDGGKPHDKRGT